MAKVEMGDSSEAFWERIYAAKTGPSGGRPSAVLTRFSAGRPTGQALDLGCARGDDAIWLARQGWTVTGVDVSQSALKAARLAAIAAGVKGRTRFEQHDLAESFPVGTFDLVSAMFLQSPVPFGRRMALRHASEAVAPGGLLLLVTHGSTAPWSWSEPDTVYPTAEDELAELALDPDAWRPLFMGSEPRMVNGPNGQRAEVLDTILAIERDLGQGYRALGQGL